MTMKKWTKLEPIFIILALFLGYLFSFVSSISEFCSYLEEPLLFILLFFIFLEIDWVDLKEALKNSKFLFLVLGINFVWTPLFAFFLGTLFLSSNIYLQIALTLLLIMPCTDWYLIFTDITGGNVPLSTSILPYNLILQLLLFPIYLGLFYGNYNVFMDYSLALETVLELLIPLVLALIVRIVTIKIKKFNSFEKKIHQYSDKTEFIIVCIIAFSIFASEGSFLLEAITSFYSFLLALLGFYVVNFILSYSIGKIFKFNNENLISLVFAATARNTPLTLSLAGILYPDYKIISLVLLIGPLTELPVSLFESFMLKRLIKDRIKFD